MTTTTPIPVGSNGEYLDDRYGKLRNAAETIASDPNVAESDSIFGAEGLRAFIGSLIDARILDGLSDDDADTVAMLVVLDFTRGPHQLGWRIHEWLNGHTLTREDEGNPWAVCAALASALKVMLDGLKPLGDPEIDAMTEDQARLG